LYVGTRELNGFYEPVDRIKDLLGGAATVFMGDERITTNVKKPDGSRAVGTRLARGPVYDSLFGQGHAFHGEADILGQAYFVAYEPLRDADGQVIGALFVGTPKAEFYSGINALARQCILVTLLLAGVAVAVCLFATRRMFQPLGALRVSAERLSRGDMSVDIGFTDRRDELGQLAQVLVGLREANREKAVIEAGKVAAEAEKQQMAAAAAAQRRELEVRERQELEARVAGATAQRRTVEVLAAGLERLSLGDLGCRIDEPFHADYEKLRADFNSAMRTLGATLGAIHSSAVSIRTSTEGMRNGTAELADRTQLQAARLDSTAAALGRVSGRIQETATAATTTRASVDAAREEAEQSAVVVRKAVEAMSQIEDSSNQIQRIIGVIDAIAFQTNLLALNAAVEAARAGDQGRGFAVVAAEVRNLASRTSDAAKQVKELIMRSCEQVGGGTALVGATGEALTRIVRQVNEINEMVRAIDANAMAQAEEVRAVDGALAELDVLTRQNTAMVERSTSATERLAEEAVDLVDRVGRFQLGMPAGDSEAVMGPTRRRA
jgi:methyl-accepting chemotaxis protein